MDSLKVLQVATSYPQFRNDVSGPFIHRFVKALERSGGVSCTVLTPCGTVKSSWPGEGRVIRFPYAPRRLQVLAQRPGGIPRALDENPANYLLVGPFLFSMWFHLLRHSYRFQLIHAHWSVTGFVASLIPCSRPLVVTLHGSDVNRAATSKAYSFILKRVLKRANAVVAVSEQMRLGLKDAFSQHASKIYFIANGVDEEFYEIDPAPRWQRRPVRFLYLGSLLEAKGVSVLIEALAGLKEKGDWVLDVAGEGPERERLEALVQGHNLSNRVFFKGCIPPGKVAHLMASCHCLVLPSFQEGRPSVVLEAMAAALPVITTDIPGTRELVKSGETGLLVPPKNRDELTKALETVLDHPERAQRFGERGRMWMAEKGLTWENTAKRYMALYRQILKMD